eukprot:SAG22_NODE_485_length_9905_cov_35.562003_3_plen_872_part_00
MHHVLQQYRYLYLRRQRLSRADHYHYLNHCPPLAMGRHNKEGRARRAGVAPRARQAPRPDLQMRRWPKLARDLLAVSLIHSTVTETATTEVVSGRQLQSGCGATSCGLATAGYLSGRTGALFQHNIEISGSEVTIVPTLAACQQLCTAYGDGCRSIDYSEGLGGRCYLGDEVDGADESAYVDSTACIYCYYERDFSGSVVTALASFAAPAPGILAGNNLPNALGASFTSGLTAEQCAQLCLDYLPAGGCQSFDFGVQPGESETRCYLGSCEVLNGGDCAPTATLSANNHYQYYARQQSFASCTIANNVTDGNIGDCPADLRLAHGATCTLGCAAGYVPTGLQPTCTDGAISQAVVCQLLSGGSTANCALSLPPNAGWGSCASSGVLLHGQSCSVACDGGYTLVGASALTCVGGSLARGAQGCSPTSATPPPGGCVLTVPLHGNIGDCPSTRVLSNGGSCGLGCTAGYDAVGVQPQSTCADGVLSGSVACQPRGCAELVASPNSVLRSCVNTAGPALGAPFPSGAACEVACNPTYVPGGLAAAGGLVSCRAGQLIPGSMPTCLAASALATVCQDRSVQGRQPCYEEVFASSNGLAQGACDASLLQRCGASCNPRACAVAGEARLRLEFRSRTIAQVEGDWGTAAAFGRAVATQLASALRVNASRAVVLEVAGGSVIVRLKLLPGLAATSSPRARTGSALQLLDTLASGYGAASLFEGICNPDDSSCVAYEVESAPSDYVPLGPATVQVPTYIYAPAPPAAADEDWDFEWLSTTLLVLLLLWLLLAMVWTRECVCCRPVREALTLRERPWQVACLCGMEFVCCGDAWERDKTKVLKADQPYGNSTEWLHLDTIDQKPAATVTQTQGAADRAMT